MDCLYLASFLFFLNSSFISKSLTKAITIYNSQRPSDISNRSLPPAPPPPMGTQIPNPIGPPSIPMQEHSLINQAEPPTTSNFQNRGLCGLRWGLKNKTLLDVWRFLKHFGALSENQAHIFFSIKVEWVSHFTFFSIFFRSCHES